VADRDAIVRTACDTLERYAARFEPTDGAMLLDIVKDLRGTLPAPSIPPPAAMPAHLAWALNELGEKEVAGDADNPRIVWYHGHTHGGPASDEVPWCSSFVCSALEESGLVSTKSKAAASWLSWGVETKQFVPGCIVVLSRGPRQYHVAIGIQMSASYGTIEVVGGNQGNAVTRKWRNVGDVVSMRLPITVKP